MPDFTFSDTCTTSGTDFNFSGEQFNFTSDDVFPGAEYDFLFGTLGYTFEYVYVLNGTVNEFTNVWHFNTASCSTSEFIYITTASGLQIVSKQEDNYELVLVEGSDTLYIDMCSF